MEANVVTTIWMGGVIAVMVVYAVAIAIGHYKQKSRDRSK